MIMCSFCGGETSRSGDDLSCPVCGNRFRVADGVYAFPASSSPDDREGYSDEYFEVNSRKEKEHFWFVSRNSLVMRLCDRYADPAARFIEIGCGTGNILELLNKRKWKTDGSDVSLAALKFARSKVAADFYQADICTLPFIEEYDAVVMTDVLEHIDNDQLALSNVWRALKPGGLLIITVPAVSRLFGAYDKLLYHRRRYDLAPLSALLASAGFGIVKATYFNLLLFPLLYIKRKLGGGKAPRNAEEEKALLDKELRIIPVLNAILKSIMLLDGMLAMRIKMPIGGSIAIVARKKD